MPVFLSFFPKNRHFEMGSNCDVLTLKRTSLSTFFVVGRSNHLPTTSAFFRQIPSVAIYTKKLEINLTAMSRGFESHRLRQRQHPAGAASGCQKTLVGASIARPCPFACEKNLSKKRVDASGWWATNGRPYTFNRPQIRFFDTLRQHPAGAAFYFCGKGIVFGLVRVGRIVKDAL